MAHSNCFRPAAPGESVRSKRQVRRRCWPDVGSLLLAAFQGVACFDFKPTFCQGMCGNIDPAGASSGNAAAGSGPSASAGAAGAGASPGGGASGASAVLPSGGAAGEGGQAGALVAVRDGGADAAPEAGGVDPCGEELVAKPTRLCLGAECLELDCPLRRALVLWLDPTGLPPAGQQVSSWRDRSGLANDAERQELETNPPLPVQDEARSVPEPLQRSLVLEGSWLKVAQPPGNTSLRFGTEEFLVLVAASAPPTAGDAYTYLYTTQDSYGNLQLSLAPACGGILGIDGLLTPALTMFSASNGLLDDRPRLYGMQRRSPTELELRLNGSSTGLLRCLSPTLSLNADPAIASTAIGTGFINRTPSDSRGRISAVVVFKGHLEPQQVTSIEQFLCQQLGVCSAVPPLTDAGLAPGCQTPEEFATCQG